MGTGLIVAFVVAVWAAYFVPLALRRYDEASTTSSLESLSHLSRVIRRMGNSAEEPETSEAEPAASPQSAPPESTVSRPAHRPQISSKAARVAAKRRRRTLLTLLFSAVVVTGMAAFGLIPWVYVSAPAALIVAWLVACRIQVRGELGLTPIKKPAIKKRQRSVDATPDLPRPARRWMPRRLQQDSPDVVVARKLSPDEEVTVVVSGQFEDIDPGRKHVMEQAELEADALDEKLVIAVPSVGSNGEALWDPLPVTLPTYVTKPRAGRTVRTIDFTQPGTWTSGHVEGENTELPGKGSADEDLGDERRAVGH